MFKSLFVFMIFFFAGITIHTLPAAAKCSDNTRCGAATFKKLGARYYTSKNSFYSTNYNKNRYATQHGSRREYAHISKQNRASAASRNHVVALIKSLAPRYGVPTWFALRIAKVESGYNPRAHGRAGEIGVFQLKCSTARGLGYRGGCSGLYNASANVQFGLRHLSLAIKSSRGNLKLAASKHNGGLGRKQLVKNYVSMVF